MSGWVKIPDSWLESDKVERLGSEAVLLHLSALSYSCRHGSDGRLPTNALRRLWPVTDTDAAIAALSTAGEWEPDDDGWFLPNWNEHLLAADEVEHRRQVSRDTSERFRRHKVGDHSMCERCAFVRGGGDVSPDTSVTASVTSLGTQRLDSERNVVREERRDEDGAGPGSATATPGRASGEVESLRCPHGTLRGLHYKAGSFVCGKCEELTPENLDFIAVSRASMEKEDGPHIGAVMEQLYLDMPQEQLDMAHDIADSVYDRLVPDPINEQGLRRDVEAFQWINAFVLSSLDLGCIIAARAAIEANA